MPDDHAEDGLFAAEAVDRVEIDAAAPKPPVDKTFRPFDPDQVVLLPPSLDVVGSADPGSASPAQITAVRVSGETLSSATAPVDETGRAALQILRARDAGLGSSLRT